MGIPRTKFRRTKKSKFRNITWLSSLLCLGLSSLLFLGLGSLLFLANHHDYKGTPSAEDKKGRKTEPKPITLTMTTTNASTTSNISNIDKIQPANAHEPMASNSSSQSGLTTPPTIRIFNLPCPEHLHTLWFDGMDVTEFLCHWNIECQDAGHDGKAKCE